MNLHLAAGCVVLLPAAACADSPTPPWAGSRVGRSDAVLKPWTPVVPEGNSIRCWGREYRWGALPFPVQTLTQGHEILAIALLHDVVPRPDLTKRGLAKIAPYWRAFDAADGAEWFPYWHNSEYVTTSDPEAMKVSFYRVKPRGLLVVVSNLGDRPLDGAAVTFNMAKLGLPASGQAVDAISGEAVPVVSGVMHLAVASNRARVISFRP